MATITSTSSASFRSFYRQHSGDGQSVSISVTASGDASLLETVTISVTVQSVTSTTTVTVDPSPLFYFQGTTSEITSTLNGATVVANTAPGNWPGVLSLIGSGKLAFNPVQGSSGVSFHNGGSQNTNTAFINFSGTQAGQVFNPQGEVALMLKSAYSFAQRQALPSPNSRYAFMVNDDTRTQFALNVYTSSGRLIAGICDWRHFHLLLCAGRPGRRVVRRGGSAECQGHLDHYLCHALPQRAVGDDDFLCAGFSPTGRRARHSPSDLPSVGIMLPMTPSQRSNSITTSGELSVYTQRGEPDLAAGASQNGCVDLGPATTKGKPRQAVAWDVRR